MDKATEYLLLQENKLNDMLSSLKLILPNAKSSLLKGDEKRMKMIAKRLPQKSVQSIERDAIRQIPDFKENFKKAKILTSRSKNFNEITTKPAAIAIALVSSSTKKSVDAVYKEGENKLRKMSLSPLGIYGGLAKLGLLIIVIVFLYYADLSQISSAIQIVLKSAGLLLSLLSNALVSVAKILSVFDGPLATQVTDTLANVNPELWDDLKLMWE